MDVDAQTTTTVDVDVHQWEDSLEDVEIVKYYSSLSYSYFYSQTVDADAEEVVAKRNTYKQGASKRSTLFSLNSCDKIGRNGNNRDRIKEG